jgi:hypothetical protein
MIDWTLTYLDGTLFSHANAKEIELILHRWKRDSSCGISHGSIATTAEKKQHEEETMQHIRHHGRRRQ